jgi:hypothetical protein
MKLRGSQKTKYGIITFEKRIRRGLKWKHMVP